MLKEWFGDEADAELMVDDVVMENTLGSQNEHWLKCATILYCTHSTNNLAIVFYIMNSTENCQAAVNIFSVNHAVNDSPRKQFNLGVFVNIQLKKGFLWDIFECNNVKVVKLCKEL